MFFFSLAVSTRKPKVHKISHVFQTTNSQVPDTPIISKDIGSEGDDDEMEDESTKKVPKQFNIEEDRRFLSRSMSLTNLFNFNKFTILFLFINLVTIDIHQTRWHHGVAVKFIYSFPFFSEIIAIIWTAMCFIFQSGVKKTW